MTRADVIGLVGKTYTTDAIGQVVKTESVTPVFGEISSVTSAEFFRAGETGIRAELVAKTQVINYNGQDEAEVGGKRYVIYRTYESADTVELYLAARAGV